MPGLLTAMQWILGVLVACGTAYHLLAAWCAASYLRGARRREDLAAQRASDTRAAWPPVSILKPLRGADAGAFECFASFCRQDYPEYELVFGTLDADDPAIALVQRLQHEYPQVPIRLVVCARRSGANLKVCNLANMLPEARFNWVLISDSDMRVAPEYLRRVACGLLEPGVGLVTCPYRGANPDSAAAVLEALGIATDFLPGVLMVARLGRPDFAFGSTIALERETLAETGGLEAIADYLADDFQLGHRVVLSGRQVHLSSYVVDNVLGREDLKSMLTRRLRWARTVRVCRPLGHAASVVTQSTFFALALLAVCGFRWQGWAALGLQQVARSGCAWFTAVRSLGNRELGRRFLLLPASDLLNFCLWVGSWMGQHVTWRGVRFRLYAGGRIRAR